MLAKLYFEALVFLWETIGEDKISERLRMKCLASFW
jgi:hypothetical protein